MRPFDLRASVRHGAITAAFCCAIAATLTLSGRGRWDINLVYSLAIGLTSWLAIDLGRHYLTRHDTIEWPLGWRGMLLTSAGIGIGFVLGNRIGNAYSGNTLGELHQHTNTRASLAITIAASLTITGFFYSWGKARYLQTHMALAQRDAAEARLKLLQTQLEPHMLFNTLANLRALIGHDPARAQHMLDHLSAYLRATLSASRSTQHPLGNEFERLRDYLELMAVRMGPRLRYTLELPPELATHPIPPLLLQPLVENSIIHGLEPQLAGGHIHIQARAHHQQLQLLVSDNGTGMPTHSTQPPATASTTPGFGLAQVRERLHTAYGPAATLQCSAATPQGTHITISLPLHPPSPPHDAPHAPPPRHSPDC